MSRRRVDLNADLGEGVHTASLGADRLDAALLGIVTSANVACGGHAGDDASMARVCADAVRLGVAIGAQVSYLDRVGFGRTRIDVAHDVLVAQLVEQVGTLRAHAVAVGGAVDYLKPHGALYNAAVDDPAVAQTVVDAVLTDASTTGRALPLLTLPGSQLARAAIACGLVVHREAFADRAYDARGRLVARSEPGAVIHDPDTVVARVRRLVHDGVVRAVDGSDVPVDAESICLHSDTADALGLAGRVRAALEADGVEVSAFTRPT